MIREACMKRDDFLRTKKWKLYVRKNSNIAERVTTLSWHQTFYKFFQFDTYDLNDSLKPSLKNKVVTLDFPNIGKAPSIGPADTDVTTVKKKRFP